MPTFTAQTHINKPSIPAGRWLLGQIIARRENALVLVELMVVMVIIAFMLGITMLSLTGVAGRSKFKQDAYKLVNTLKMAQNAAAKSDRRYAVILDFTEQTYTLRQFASLNLDIIPEDEAIISVSSFSDRCRLDYVIFDDFLDTRSWDLENSEYFRARFMAGHSGWQYGGKIVLLDIDGNQYSIVVNRLSKVIELKPGDVEILAAMENVPF